MQKMNIFEVLNKNNTGIEFVFRKTKAVEG